MFNLLPANALNLDWTKILPSGHRLKTLSEMKEMLKTPLNAIQTNNLGQYYMEIPCKVYPFLKIL